MQDYIGQLSCVEGEENKLLLVTHDQTFELLVPCRMKVFVMSLIGSNVMIRGEVSRDPSRYLVTLTVKMIGVE